MRLAQVELPTHRRGAWVWAPVQRVELRLQGLRIADPFLKAVLPSTANSISAMLSHEPCFGVWTKLNSRASRRVFPGSNAR